MKTTTSVGRYGEDIAAAWLSEHGYVIVERNYRRRFGEVDIIAEQDGYLVFIEVKTRSSSRFGTPFDAVTLKKQQQLSRIAGEYLQHHGQTNTRCRFDVLAVRLEAGKPPKVDVIVNAFEACE
ncbi:MAG TPA: YraN family protein [Desulfobulbaceae bacterium]|nr:YraN family protein [Desulfobulbaceae bacterium]